MLRTLPFALLALLASTGCTDDDSFGPAVNPAAGVDSAELRFGCAPAGNGPLLDEEYVMLFIDPSDGHITRFAANLSETEDAVSFDLTPLPPEVENYEPVGDATRVALGRDAEGVYTLRDFEMTLPADAMRDRDEDARLSADVAGVPCAGSSAWRGTFTGAFGDGETFEGPWLMVVKPR
ncbi:MAG: hypothetical protein AAGA56_25250 [Myxococcota bacterium]